MIKEGFYYKKIKYKTIVVFSLVLSTILLTACSDKPDDVRQEIWENSIEAFKMLEEDMNTNDVTNVELSDKISIMYGTYKDNHDLTINEYKLINGLMDMLDANIEYKDAIFTKNDELRKRAMTDYEIAKEIVQEVIEGR